MIKKSNTKIPLRCDDVNIRIRFKIFHFINHNFHNTNVIKKFDLRKKNLQIENRTAFGVNHIFNLQQERQSQIDREPNS